MAASAVAVASRVVAARTAARAPFRNALSIGFTERAFEQGIVFSDGTRDASSAQELQRLFIEHGATEMYARIGTRINRGNSLEAAQGRARLATKLGMALSPEIGLWDQYGGWPDFQDWPEIVVPKPWDQMNADEMVPVVRQFGTLLARQLKTTGAAIVNWNLSGDEHGIGGLTTPFIGPFLRPATYRAPNGVDPAIGALDGKVFEALPDSERVAWYTTHLWPHTGKVLAALATGIREIYPDARFSTHIGSSPTPAYLPRLITAFFEAHDATGYRVDELGVCFFPSSAETPENRVQAFRDSLTQVSTRLRRSFFIAEFGYPVAKVSVGGPDSAAEDWGHATAGYLLSAEGQANLTRDLVKWGSSSGILAGIRQWGPDGVLGPFAPMSLFELAGKRATARPALNAVAQGIERTRLTESLWRDRMLISLR
jgi:hypothetical protein